MCATWGSSRTRCFRVRRILVSPRSAVAVRRPASPKAAKLFERRRLYETGVRKSMAAGVYPGTHVTLITIDAAIIRVCQSVWSDK